MVEIYRKDIKNNHLSADAAHAAERAQQTRHDLAQQREYVRKSKAVAEKLQKLAHTIEDQIARLEVMQGKVLAGKGADPLRDMEIKRTVEKICAETTLEYRKRTYALERKEEELENRMYLFDSDPARVSEAKACVIGQTEDGLSLFNTARLIRQPYLQAAYAEILRLQTHTYIVRHAKQSAKEKNWRIPDGSFVTIPTTPAHMHTEQWTKAER